MYQQTDQLARLIAKKHQVLSNLLALGARQAELIQANELDLLLKVLSGKQRLLDDLLATDGKLNAYRDQLPESRVWRSEELRQKCGELATDCERMLAVIVQQEKESETEMTRRRDDTGGRLDGAHTAMQAHNAYQQHATPRRSQASLPSSTGPQQPLDPSSGSMS